MVLMLSQWMGNHRGKSWNTDVWSVKCVFLTKSVTNLCASSVTKGRILEYKLNTGELLILGRREGVETFLWHRDTLAWGPSVRSNEPWSGKRGTPTDTAASGGWSPRWCLRGSRRESWGPSSCHWPRLRLHLGRRRRGPLQTSSLEGYL